MKRYLFVLMSAVLLCGLTACDPKLDLKNMDPTAKLAMGLTLPVGEVHAKIGDFVGDSTLKFIKIREDGYHYVDSFSTYRTFYNVELGKYQSSDTRKMLLYTKFPAGVTYIPAGVEHTMEFDMWLHLSHVNDSLDNERLDSMTIDTASFSSYIMNNFSLPYEDVKSLEIILPANIRRPKGQVLNIPLQGSDWGSELPIMIDNFTINLMKDPNAEPSNQNVTDSVKFTFRFKVKTSQNVPFTHTSAFTYRLNVNFLHYNSLFGYFKESGRVVDDDTVWIGHEWSGWYDLQQFVLPVSDPLVDIILKMNVGAPLRVEIQDMWVADSLFKEKNYATFNHGTEQTYTKSLPNFVRVTDPLETFSVNHLFFSKDEGSLDKIVKVRPDVFHYNMALRSEYRDGVKQHRLTNNTTVDITAAIDVPFKFNEGTRLEFKDTAEVNISEFSIDSLTRQIEAIDSLSVNDLRLVLGVKNYIPFDLSGEFTFLDADKKPLDLHPAEGNHLEIPKPTDYSVAGVPNKPGEVQLTIALDQKGIETLPKVKYIYYHACILDVNANSGVKYPVALTPETKLVMKVAVSADAEGWFKLQF